MTPPNHTTRLGIDCRLLGKKHAGIGRYIENLLLSISNTKTSEQFHWTFFFHDKNQFSEFLTQPETNHGFFKRQDVVFAPIRHYSLEEQLRMPAIFSEHNLDLLHVPHFNIPLFYPGKLVVTIHDLLWHEFGGRAVTTLSSWKYWVKHLGYRIIVAQALKKASSVIVPTGTIKKTIVQYFPQFEQKLVVTYEGVDPSFFTTRFSHDPTKSNALVYVGSLYPHKNIEVVLEFLQKNPDYHLHLVGSRTIFQEQTKERVKTLGITQQVTFHGYLTDPELIQLFQKCRALVQPSLSEGFGLTGVEALATGLPVVASNIPIFQEIYREHAYYFNPYSSNELGTQVQKIEESLKTSERKKYQQFVKQEYDWIRMTNQVLHIYRQCVALT